MGRVQSKEVKIYCPVGFRATWEKYLAICKRDGTNASREVRIYVEGQVARRDPGNPQTTMESHIPGTEDAMAKRRSDTIKELLIAADARGGELTYAHVVKAIREASNPLGYMIPVLARSMCKDLEKLGARILWPARGAF